MAVLNPETWDHENSWFGEDEVSALCCVLHVSEQETHIGFVEFKACGGRKIPDKMKKLIMAVDTLSASNADCERGFYELYEQYYNRVQKQITNKKM